MVICQECKNITSKTSYLCASCSKRYNHVTRHTLVVPTTTEFDWDRRSSGRTDPDNQWLRDFLDIVEGRTL